MRATVIKAQTLSAPLAFVITRAQARRIYVAPIRLGLGVYGRLPIDLAGGGLQQTRAAFSRDLEKIARAAHARHGRADRIRLVVQRRGRARKIENSADTVDLEWIADIDLAHVKSRVAH